jgi:arylformamidase
MLLILDVWINNEREMTAMQDKVTDIGLHQSFLTGTGWLDVTVPIRSHMLTWPGDPQVLIEPVTDVKTGAHFSVSRMTMSTHSGTHVDAPLHVFPEGEGIDRVPLETFIGQARVIEILDTVSIKREQLVHSKIKHGERLLFKTMNSRRTRHINTFIQDFVHLSEDAAKYIVEIKPFLIGVDYLSISGFDNQGRIIHARLLKAGISIIEGLNLSAISPGEYDMICLPLLVHNGDGAPARVLLRPIV